MPLKERFQVQCVPYMHYHEPRNIGETATGVVEGFNTMSFSTNTHKEAVKLGKKKCKDGEWYAFTIDKFYYWEE